MEMLGAKVHLNYVKGDFPKNLFESDAWSSNQVICGLDEVGRGCLAGPIIGEDGVRLKRVVIADNIY